jgi:osmoprotectant transport system ATP-binding protein
MLVFKQVAKAYNDAAALHPTSFHIPEGETSVLIGPSGCGKSTLLRLVAGIVRPDSGSIEFKGTPITRENLNDLRHRMGYVIQEGGLFPHLTVERNVTLLARHLSWSARRITSRLKELADLMQISKNMLDRYPDELSGGQRQRVSLMRALMLDPDLLLLDEPLGALDPMIRYELQQELKSIFARLKKTVLLVTHDIAEAAYFGHSLVLMREGRIVQQGAFHELVKQPKEPFVEQFIRAQRVPLQMLSEALL